MLRHSVDQSDSGTIRAHLVQCDAQFVPALSSRVDLAAYAAKLADHALRHEVWMGQSLVALVAIYANAPDKACAFVSNVSVCQDHQGKGLARQSLTNAIEQVRAMGFARLGLEVHQHNEPALRLYSGLGFTPCAQRGDMVELSLEMKENA